jgi:hypothetical protein
VTTLCNKLRISQNNSRLSKHTLYCNKNWNLVFLQSKIPCIREVGTLDAIGLRLDSLSFKFGILVLKKIKILHQYLDRLILIEQLLMFQVHECGRLPTNGSPISTNCHHILICKYIYMFFHYAGDDKWDIQSTRAQSCSK